MSIAKNNLRDMSSKLQNYIDNNSIDKELDSLIYDSADKWLGIKINSNDIASTIKGNIDKIIEEVSNTTNFKVDSSKEAKKTFAYVYTNRKDGTIYFDGAVKYGKTKGNNTLAGTILHELSHKLIKTEDVIINVKTKERAYGLTKSLNLPNGDKIKNADNWEYFYEKIYTDGS